MPDGLTVGDYLVDCLERRRTQLRPTTHHCCRQLIRAYLRPRLDHHELTDLDRPDLERAYAELFSGGGRGQPGPHRATAAKRPLGRRARRRPAGLDQSSRRRAF